MSARHKAPPAVVKYWAIRGYDVSPYGAHTLKNGMPNAIKKVTGRPANARLPGAALGSDLVPPRGPAKRTDMSAPSMCMSVQTVINPAPLPPAPPSKVSMLMDELDAMKQQMAKILTKLEGRKTSAALPPTQLSENAVLMGEIDNLNKEAAKMRAGEAALRREIADINHTVNGLREKLEDVSEGAISTTRFSRSHKLVSINKVNTALEFIARDHGLTVGELKGASRARPVVNARFEAYYYLRKDLRMSCSQIGRVMGDRDHSTVLYGSSKYAERLDAAIEATEKTLGSVL